MERRKFIAGVGAAAATAAVCQSNPLSAQTTSGVGHRTAEANGIHIHVAEQGDGPLVILCHGFPSPAAPVEGFLHRTNELDTLGDDEPETPCHLNK
jgi:hypothetical protein